MGGVVLEIDTAAESVEFECDVPYSHISNQIEWQSTNDLWAAVRDSLHDAGMEAGEGWTDSLHDAGMEAGEGWTNT